MHKVKGAGGEGKRERVGGETRGGREAEVAGAEIERGDAGAREGALDGAGEVTGGGADIQDGEFVSVRHVFSQ